MKASGKLYSNVLIKWSFDPLSWPPAAENYLKIAFLIIILLRGLYTVWQRKLNFGMDNGSDLYFHILNKNWKEGHAGPPSGQKIPWKKNWVMWHIKWKFLKNYSSMPIKCSFDTLSDRQQPKITWKIAIFVDCFIEEGMSTLVELRSWILAWTMFLTYIFIFWTRIGERGTLNPPLGGYPPENTLKKKNWVMWHIKWRLLKNSIQICRLNVHLTTKIIPY